jgi:DNA primase
MPEGKDPADLLASEGRAAFAERLDRTLSVPEFQARRIIASADLGTPHGRDRALAEVRPLVDGLRESPATRDALVRFVSDRLDIDREFLMTQVSAPMAWGEAERTGRAAEPALRRPSLDAIARAERTFVAMCVAAADLGRDYIERLEPEHLTFRPLREVRDHLLAHWDDPLADLPEEDPTISALVKDVVMRADEEEVTAEALRLDFLKLERQRVDRALRHAEEAGDFEAQRTLARERQSLIEQFSDLMGTTL